MSTPSQPKKHNYFLQQHKRPTSKKARDTTQATHESLKYAYAREETTMHGKDNNAR